MIEIISSWAKSLGVAIVLVSIIEMILPNNKTKKYIRMILGIFIIFNIISPFINNKNKFDLTSINIEEYYTEEVEKNSNSINKNLRKDTENTENLNQTSMNQRIKILYQEELEKDIKNKIQELGFQVKSCKVEATLPTEQERDKYQ